MTNISYEGETEFRFFADYSCEEKLALAEIAYQLKRIADKLDLWNRLNALAVDTGK